MKNKILIIGAVASGKTTFAKKISVKKKIKYYSIDSIVHDDLLNKKRTKDEQDSIINKINKNNSWIIEGTLRKNLYYLLDLCDLIIYIDISKSIRKYRIMKRYIKQKLSLEKCCYKPSFKMISNMYKWTSEFEENRNDFERNLSKYNNKLIVLKSKKEINKYLEKR